MKREELLKKLEELEEEILTWTSDGGLTYAASDALALISRIKQLVREEDWETLSDWTGHSDRDYSTFENCTGTEQEALSLCWQFLDELP